jgi:lipopolysaccharide heptosyltransferase I
MIKLHSSKTTLFIRLSALGDIIMSSYVATVLHERLPGARIVWLVQQEGKDLVDHNENVDDIIILPRKEWRELWVQRKWFLLVREIYIFRRNLRSYNFDLVIDAQGLLKSGIWAWLSGAPRRIGLGSKEGSQFLMTHVIDKPKGDMRIGSEYRHLIRELGFDGSGYRMHVGLAPDDDRFTENFIKDNGLATGYIVLCPFTTRPQKHWIDSHWAKLIDRINNELKLPVVILGGPGDQEAAEAIIERTSIRLFNLVGKTNLRQAAALIKNASLLIGVDTGLTHMGTAFEIPTIALFGSTCPYLETDSNKTRIIYKNLECSPCRRKPTCDGDYTCMKLITAEEVIDTARELLPKA